MIGLGDIIPLNSTLAIRFGRMSYLLAVPDAAHLGCTKMDNCLFRHRSASVLDLACLGDDSQNHRSLAARCSDSPSTEVRFDLLRNSFQAALAEDSSTSLLVVAIVPSKAFGSSWASFLDLGMRVVSSVVPSCDCVRKGVSAFGAFGASGASYEHCMEFARSDAASLGDNRRVARDRCTGTSAYQDASLDASPGDRV